MKNIIRGLLLCVLTAATPALANDIYIEQVGDTLDLDITQDGANNVIGTATTDVNLEGDDMTFAITQTGSTNVIVADIQGSSYTGTWVFTGDSNEVELSCDSTSGTNCENITLNITATGDSNDFVLAIGDTADADGSTVAFTLTGDGNVVNTEVDGKSAAVTVVVNNASTTSTGTPTITGGATAAAGGNAIDIDIDGNGDSQGHTVNLNVTGGGSSYKITQSGINDNIVDADFAGDDQDVTITQSD
jgi:hypothetical protein